MMETAPATLIVATKYLCFLKSPFGAQDWDPSLIAGLETNVDHHPASFNTDISWKDFFFYS